MNKRAFTLIELLIVVAIITILAAIAVPNFLEAQTRAIVSRVKSDMRSLVTGIEAYRVDHNKYPSGADEPECIDPAINDALAPLSDCFYTIQTRQGDTITAGRDFATLTTPSPYITEFFKDPFSGQGKKVVFTYAYRPAEVKHNGYIITSFGPDVDMFTQLGAKPGTGTTNMDSPFSTARDQKAIARMGDINEKYACRYMEREDEIPGLVDAVDQMGGIRPALEVLVYDPTNGTTSDGDIYRIGP